MPAPPRPDGKTATVTQRIELPSGRLWWIPASVAVGWLMIAATRVPAWIGWIYVVANIIGTGIALRLQVARLEEWGDARPDRRPLLRLLCVAQLPVGWATLVLTVFSIG